MDIRKNVLIFLFFITTLLLGCAQRGDHMPLLPGNTTKSNQESTQPSAPGTTPGNPDSSKNSTYCEKITFSEIGYEEDIVPFVEKYCKVCHQTAPKNWMDYQTFAAAKDVVYNRVFNTKDMPLGMPRPKDEELTLLKQWLEGGVPQNRGKQSKTIPCPPENDPTTNIL